MTHDPAAYARAVLTAAADLADIMNRTRDTGAELNVTAIIAAATSHLAPGWMPSHEDQMNIYALAVGLCSASTEASRLNLRAALC